MKLHLPGWAFDVKRLRLSIVGLLVLGHKAAVLLFVYLSMELLPIFDEGHFASKEVRWPLEGRSTWVSRLTTWDAADYLYLSQHGYERGSPSCAFYPLWPLLIRLGSFVFLGNPVVAGFVLGNLFSAGGVLLFALLVQEQRSEEAASLSVLLLLAFPGALFFSFIYTESLFFLLVMLFFWGLARGNVFLVAATGLLLPTAKAIGIFCLAPLFWHLLSARKAWRAWLLCLWPLLGYAGYFGCMYAFTGNPFEGFVAQKQYPNRPSVANILDVPGFIRAFVNVGSLHGFIDSAIDRVLFLIFLFCLPHLWRMNKMYFFYALGSGLVPAMSNWFFSYSRFLMMCFPVFIVLAEKLGSLQLRLTLWYVVGLMASIQIIFLIRHINNYWAG